MPATEPDGFEAATAPYRRELLAHCYRLTGSVHEAEQCETCMPGGPDGFEQRSSVRTWLPDAATCAGRLARRRRPPPSGSGRFTLTLPPGAGARWRGMVDHS
jgi:RNA polymerase sigma-70 factor (ECF subfamily)